MLTVNLSLSDEVANGLLVGDAGGLITEAYVIVTDANDNTVIAEFVMPGHILEEGAIQYQSFFEVESDVEYMIEIKNISQYTTEIDLFVRRDDTNATILGFTNVASAASTDDYFIVPFGVSSITIYKQGRVYQTSGETTGTFVINNPEYLLLANTSGATSSLPNVAFFDSPVGEFTNRYFVDYDKPFALVLKPFAGLEVNAVLYRSMIPESAYEGFVNDGMIRPIGANNVDGSLFRGGVYHPPTQEPQVYDPEQPTRSSTIRRRSNAIIDKRLY